MAVVGAIAYLHLGLVAGLARLQDRQPSSELRLSRHWNESQISALARSPGGDLDTETSDAATRFLYTGDPATLLQVNCSRRVEIRGVKGEAAVSLQPVVHGAVDSMVHATNFLNLVFQTNDIRESSVKDDIEWYHALVRSIVEADPKIYRALLTLDVPATPSKSRLALRATRERDAIFLQDVSPSHSAGNQTSDGEWFHALKYQKIPRLNKRLLNNDLHTLDTPKWSQGDSYMIDRSHVKWSRPFLDCVGDKLVPKWMVTMSTSFYGLKPDLSPEFKGVVQIDINLESLDIDQCSTGDGWFADSHRCDVKTTKCSPLKGQGFQLGAYQCVCKEGYYNPNLISINSNNRQEDETIFFSRFAVDEPRTWFQCLPCKTGCNSCVSDAPCFIQEDRHLRLAVVSFQAFSMLLVFTSMLVVYRFRKNKRIRASGLLLLETILGGAILLYFPVFILYFQPSAFRCVLLRWVRMLGFAIIYGTITLKIYRVLKVFLSRTAQRVPYMTCTRLLKMLGVIVLTVCWFLIAWTAAAWENVERKIPLVTQSHTPDGQTFNMCQLDRWDYMMATAEFLFLCWGSYLCYTVRTVPSTYHEPRFMGLAIHNEILMSAAFCSLRFTMATTLHPDWMLLLFFAHTHLTVTLTLILLLAPKFLHVGIPLREDIVAEVYEDDLDMRCSGSYLNSSITSAWSEHSLDPEDIRDELKKLYAQLEIHKTKKMTTNNPHLHKKRSSRRGLGRSIIKRITEIPDSVSRQCSRVERGGSIGAGSSNGSYKKKFNEPSSSSMKVKEDSIKNRVFSIRKSHSTYDHMRGHRDGHTGRMDSSGKDPSLLDSLMRKKLVKKASERSDTESLDAAPLVCKSASAHNLTVGKPSVQSKPGTLQKSLSVVTCAREKALMLTRKSDENSKQMGEKGQKMLTKHASSSLQLPTVATQPEVVKLSNLDRQQTTDEGAARLLVQDGRNRTLVGPPESQNLQPPSSETKVHKHVTYSMMKSSGIDRSHSSGKLDHRKKAMDLERKHHSFRHCGNASSQAKDMKEMATIRSEAKVPTRKHSGANIATRFGKSAESSKTDAIHPAECEELSSKTSEKMDQVQTGENKRERYISLIKQASTNSAIICPWDIMEEDTLIVSTSVDQKKGRSLSVCTVAPETLIHGSFKTKTTNLSLKQPKGFGLSLKHLMTAGKMKGSKREKPAIISEKAKGSPDKEAVGSMDKSSSTEFCPQDKENRNKEEKSQPIDTSSDTSLLEVGHSGSKREKYISLLKQGSANTAIICPWDVVLKETSATKIIEDPKKGRSLSVGAGIPGSSLQGTLNANDTNSSLKQNKRLALSLKLLMSPGKVQNRENKDGKSLPSDKSKVSDICPWDPGDAQSKKSLPSDKSKGMHNCPLDAGDTENKQDKRLSLDKSKPSDIYHSTNTAIICPWDIVLKETSAMSTSGDQKKGRSLSVCAGVPGSFLQGTLNANYASGLLPQNKRLALSMKLLMSPGKVQNRENKDGKLPPIEKSKVADICPCDSGDSKNQETSLPINKSKAVDICPWDLGDTKNKETSLSLIDKSKVAEICPWDSGDAKNQETSLPIDKSKAADVCPWDLGDTKNKETSLSLIDKSKVAEICPWDSGDNKNQESLLSIDKSKVAEICPWNSGESKNQESLLSIDKSKVAEICPWNSGENKNQESLLSIDKSKVAEICPWDSGGTKNQETSLPIDKSKVADICPWDSGGTKNQETSLPIDKSKVADICPWDSGGTKNQETSLPIDKSKVAEICPWDSGDTKNQETSLPIDKSKLENICPWDAGDAEMEEEKSSSIDESKFAIICPWDTVSPENSETRINEDQKKGRSQSVCASVSGSIMQDPLKVKGINDALPQSKWLALSLKLRTASEKTKDREIIGKSLLNNKSKVVNICPRETGDYQCKETLLPIDKAKVADICPWETGDTQSNEEKSQPKNKSNLSDVCPWETGTSASGESQPGTKDKSDITSICRGDRETETTVQDENKEGGKQTDKGNIAGSADSSP
ncbi:metabotropic glycine receptor-like [Narcine bancroftii]|uniref:metabotropic glycine receptor-like n=1 Tax=Narcine bancroftii TaxID=1343680 RepID=UPI0038318916